MALNLTGSMPWGHRNPSEFIDYMVQTAGVLNRFSLVDGIKSKHDVPIFNATLVMGDDLCVFDPQSTADISEKEMTVETKKWDFLNCKNVLENSYRSKMLKKGQLNPETMDAEFKAWVFEYFAKLSASEVLNLAATKIEAELAGDADVLNPTPHGVTIDKTNVLANMELAKVTMSKVMKDAVYGSADREYKPAFFVGTDVYEAWELAMAEKTAAYDTTKLENGGIPRYLGMEVILFPTLSKDSFLLTSPTNLVMLTDNYNDVKAVNAKYEEEINSDKLWGQFKIGFSYYKGSEIVYHTKA